MRSTTVIDRSISGEETVISPRDATSGVAGLRRQKHATRSSASGRFPAVLENLRVTRKEMADEAFMQESETEGSPSCARPVPECIADEMRVGLRSIFLQDIGPVLSS
jgi:hypothetical protein